MTSSDPDGWGVYVHFPWCLRVCPYCDFNVYQARDAPRREYTAAVLTQWVAARHEFPDEAPRTVFLGGGSPSLLGAELVGRVLQGLGPAPGAEVTLEANPEDADGGAWAALVDAGVNRLSLGVQSFEPAVLQKLGRAHAAELGARAVDIALAAGFERVSVDLIFGVPGQRDWEGTLHRAVALGVGHVSTYSLTVEAGTRFASDGVRAAGEDEALAMLRTSLEILGAAGFERYEVSNHARPGERSQHNGLYWAGRPWLGLGAGAHSHLPRGQRARRWAGLRRPADFMAAAEAGAVDWSEDLDADAVLRERLMMGLRRVGGVRVADPRLRGPLKRLREAGLVAPDAHDGFVRATAGGMEVLDLVVGALDGALTG